MCLTWYHRLRLTCPSAVQDWKVLRLPTVSKYCWDLALPICGTCDVYLGSILMNLLRCAYALPKLATTGCRKRFPTSWMLPERSLGLSNILVDLLLIRTGNWKFLLDKSVIWGCQSRWPNVETKSCQVRNQVLLQSLEPSCIQHLVCPRVWGHVKPCLPCPRSRLPAVEQKEKKPTRKAPGQAVAKKAASKAKAKVKAKAKATACSDN